MGSDWNGRVAGGFATGGFCRSHGKPDGILMPGRPEKKFNCYA